MREILFRGKSIITNEWVYGGIVHQTDFYGDIVDRYYIIDGTDTRDYDIGYSEQVIPETVGQYTGLTDKNGVKIFEGDAIRTDKFHNLSKIYFVKYDKDFAAFIGTSKYSFTTFDCDGDHFEVVGNIHDNPELLEVTE